MTVSSIWIFLTETDLDGNVREHSQTTLELNLDFSPSGTRDLRSYAKKVINSRALCADCQTHLGGASQKEGTCVQKNAPGMNNHMDKKKSKTSFSNKPRICPCQKLHHQPLSPLLTV
jgi:hypothetical protein